jgi:hypothetical protein
VRAAAGAAVPSRGLGPAAGQVTELPLLAGATAAARRPASTTVGQAIGISGICDQAVGRFTARHAVLWEDGVVRDIGNLGGTSWHTPMAINERGDVVGFSDLPGDDPEQPERARVPLDPRAAGIVDLGTLPGDVYSEAHGINERARSWARPASRGACRAFVWDDGDDVRLERVWSCPDTAAS